MIKPIDIGMIQARRKKLEAAGQAENDRHAKAIAGLEDECKELEIAERVFSRLALENSERAQDNRVVERNAETQATGKPKGLPPVSEMIIEALGHALTIGAPGLKPSGILSYIQGKWWPQAGSTDVGPVAWRMAQHDQLEKLKTGEYALPKYQRDQIRSKIQPEAAKTGEKTT